MKEVYRIRQELIKQIQSHLQQQLPEEACGLLAGREDTFESWTPIDNILKSPTRYRMDAEQQLRAFLQFEENGLDLLGIVHSHPSGGDLPSQIDLQEAYYPEAIYFIFYPFKEFWHYKAYRINQNQYSPVTIHVLE